MGPAAERSFATLGPALRMLGLAFAVAGGQSAHGVWLCLQAVFRGSDLRPPPSVADVLLGLLALAAGAFPRPELGGAGVLTFVAELERRQ